EKGRATVEMEKKQSAMADKRDKLEKMQEKMDEATKKEEKKGFWGKLRNAFQAIGAALAIVAGIAMIALSGGVATPLAALMIAGGALTLLSMLDQYVAEQTGHGILANYMKGLGIQNEKFLEAVDIGSQVAFAVAGIAIGIASMMTGNPAGLSTAVLNVMKFAALATIALDVAAATTGTISAVYSYEAANASAEAKDKKAEALQIDAMMQMLDDAIDQALQQLMAGSQMAADMLDQVVQSMNDRGNTASKARFTG
ncbi:MAG: type III secretion system translocon subunit SctE, partial [Pseudomonadota bacterium]